MLRQFLRIMEISIVLNDDSFEYDVYGLVKAFYPKAGVKRAEKAGDNFVSVIIDGKISVKAQIEGTGKSADCPVCTDNISEEDGRKNNKNILKRLLYGALCEITGQKLPWGTLTGIRPTKIPTRLIEEGKTDDEISGYMKETYLCSDEKTRLSIDIAHKEQKLLNTIDYENGYSLYIGIPFCPTTCLYCSFSTFPMAIWADKTDAYLDALEKEMAATGPYLKDATLQTVYIGGGTPTSLNAGQLSRLLEMTEKYFDTSKVKEWTVEAGRPDSLDEEKLRIIKESRANRISINPQTMNDDTLKLIGRCHSAKETKEKFNLARKLGIDNINMDIILGLPGEDEGKVLVTLEEIKKMAPDSLTMHSLALKRAARLNKYKDIYLEEKCDADKAMEMARAAAKEMGMEPYYLYRQKNMTGNLENIGFARAEKEGLYNILIMEEKQNILALGAGSVSKITGRGKKQRIQNVKDVNFYIERIDGMIEKKQDFLLK